MVIGIGTSVVVVCMELAGQLSTSEWQLVMTTVETEYLVSSIVDGLGWLVIIALGVVTTLDWPYALFADLENGRVSICFQYLVVWWKGSHGLDEDDLPRRDTRNGRGNLHLTIGNSILQSTSIQGSLEIHLLANHWRRSVVLESGNGGDSADHEGGGSKGVTHLV